jgi:hypothetical protein
MYAKVLDLKIFIKYQMKNWSPMIYLMPFLNGWLHKQTRTMFVFATAAEMVKIGMANQGSTMDEMTQLEIMARMHITAGYVSVINLRIELEH